MKWFVVLLSYAVYSYIGPFVCRMQSNSLYVIVLYITFQHYLYYHPTWVNIIRQQHPLFAAQYLQICQGYWDMHVFLNHHVEAWSRRYGECLQNAATLCWQNIEAMHPTNLDSILAVILKLAINHSSTIDGHSVDTHKTAINHKEISR